MAQISEDHHVVGEGSPSRRLRIFLSSTYEDLKAYVDAAEGVLRECVDVDQFKHWESTGRPTLAECRDRVRKCDALVVLLGNTYGWIPSRDEDGDGRTSITRFEVRWAREKPIPVLPFFIDDAGQKADQPPDAARLQAEFVAELQKTLGKPLASVDALRESIRESIAAVIGQYDITSVRGPAHVGQRTQGIYSQFLDRDKSRRRLRVILGESHYRGAAIVGRGGLGKSALANCMIDQLEAERLLEQVVYCHSTRPAPIDAFALFMSTMEASGRPKIAYEGSWIALNSNPQRLIEVLLEVYQQQRILLLFDAFEHNLDEDGRIQPPIVSAFVKAFVENQHLSKLLMTTRQFPALSSTETTALQEVPLDEGLPVSAAVSLLMSQSPGGVGRRKHLKAAVKAVDGIPFALERMAELLRTNRLLEVGNSVVHEKTLDAFVTLAHSTLSIPAHQTLQARAVFDEPVSAAALEHVLAGIVTPPAIDAAVEELGRGNFFFRVDPGALLGIHEIDQESSYRSIQHDGVLELRQLHARAADYYARHCTDREHSFEWTSYDQLRNDLKRFHHLVKAGQPVAAATSLGIAKAEFLNYAGHVSEIQRMFADLEISSEERRALLVKRYALAQCLAILGPFERAITELQEVIELARMLGDTGAALGAAYELGTAYRYSGRFGDAVRLFRSVTEQLRKEGDEELRTRYLYGHSLACSYAGLYAEAIHLGQEQVRYGKRVGQSEFVGRGNSCLCLPYYVIGLASEAAICALASVRQFEETSSSLVGFIENVYGLSLHALGRCAEAVDAFSRASQTAKRTGQRRAEGLAAVNWAWVLYEQGDLDGAELRIGDGIRAFKEMSKVDARLSHNLREAFEYARDGDAQGEADALWNFVASNHVNPDLIRRTTVATQILSPPRQVSPQTRQLALEFIESTEKSLLAIRAELER